MLSREHEVAIEAMLKELTDNRMELKILLKRIIEFRDNLDKLMPKTLNYKNNYVIAERMKTFTSIYEAELSIRRAVNDSIKLETDIRRKMDIKELSEEQYAEEVKRMAAALESLQRNKGHELKIQTTG